jgi:hypothetical protein
MLFVPVEGREGECLRNRERSEKSEKSEKSGE